MAAPAAGGEAGEPGNAPGCGRGGRAPGPPGWPRALRVPPGRSLQVNASSSPGGVRSLGRLPKVQQSSTPELANKRVGAAAGWGQLLRPFSCAYVWNEHELFRDYCFPKFTAAIIQCV